MSALDAYLRAYVALFVCMLGFDIVIAAVKTIRLLRNGKGDN